MTEEMLITPSPVFEIDGQVYGELARDVQQLEIEETTEGLKTLIARFVAFGPLPNEPEERLLYLDGQHFDFGQKLNVSIGPVDDQRSIFSGYISAIEVDCQEGSEPQVVIFAEDKLMDLRMTRRARTYQNMSDADIAQEIASQHGISANVDVDGPTYDVVQQWNMSDLAFLRDRARLIQAEIWFADDALNFKSRTKRQGTQLTLVHGNHLISVQARADLAHQRTKVRVSGYNAQDRAVIDQEARSDAIDSEVFEGRTGPSVLSQAFGERVSHRVRDVPLVEEEATQWARSQMLQRARRFVCVRGVTRGTADLTVGSTLTLDRIAVPFDGEGYYVTRTCHTYSPNPSEGYRTHFDAERATIQEGS